MKLLPVNSNWRVQSLGRRDIDAPMREANAKVRAANAWKSLDGSAARRASSLLADIADQSSSQEAQSLYVKALGRFNELENKMYTTQQFDMKSPEMKGIQYDDSFTKTVDGSPVTGNYGYAPKHVVGAEVWSSGSNSIMEEIAGEASTDKVRGMVNNKLQATITAKNQSVGRHVTEAAIADRKTSLKFGIDESMRAGDLPGALMLSEEGYRRGIINQKEANDYDARSYQQNDLRIFREEIANSETEASLTKVANTAVFAESYLSSGQRAQISNEALSKSRLIHQRIKEKVTLTQDENEMQAMVDFHTNSTDVEQLLTERSMYNRAGFTRLYKFMTTTTPKYSDGFTSDMFEKRIMNVQFYSSENNPVATTQVEIMNDMQQAVLRGTLTYNDFKQNAEQLDKNAKAPFKRQPYEQTKVSILTSLLDGLDASTIASIASGGINMPALMTEAMGNKPAVAALGLRAINDLNAYVRNYGYQADPVKWWKENKESYKSSNSVDKYASEFAARYPEDAVFLSNGSVDVQGTQDNVIRNYRNGQYGPQGELESLRVLEKKSRWLRGEPPIGVENEQY